MHTPRPARWPQPGPPPAPPLPPAAPPPLPPSSCCSPDRFLLRVACLGAGHRLCEAWRQFLRAHPAFLSGIHDLGRGQGMTLPGRADLTVDPLGGLHLSPPRAPRDLGARLLRELTVQGGTIRIGGGPPVPFGATGAILRLPDGTQVAVGRTHEGPDAPACRWTVAGPGEHIPTHPPGATALFRIDPCGTIHPAGRC